MRENGIRESSWGTKNQIIPQQKRKKLSEKKKAKLQGAG